MYNRCLAARVNLKFKGGKKIDYKLKKNVVIAVVI